MKKAIVSIVILAVLGGGGYGYYRYTQKPAEPEVLTLNVSRGNILDTVGSTGQLSAVRTVPVGSQVGGKVLALYADYNNIVREGQLLAEIDPETIKTQILNAQANLVRAQTDVERAKVTLADSEQKLERSKALAAKNLVPKTDMDAAQLSYFSAQSGVKTNDAALLQAQASLKTQELNLTYTKIYSPIDGVVISRAVDVGQTVSVSTQAPTIFNLATDLTTMKVLAGVDETDVGRIRPQQHATFRVDAYPGETFTGTVEQVRLEARMQQNVVTYQTVISVPNPELKLKPGMTANINIEISRRDDVLRIPNPALRFRPTNDMYTALGLQPPPDQGRGGRGGAGGRGGPGGAPGTGAPAAPGQPGAPLPNGQSTSNGAATPAGQPPAPGAAPARSGAAPNLQASADGQLSADRGGAGSRGGQGQRGAGGGGGQGQGGSRGANGFNGGNRQNMTPEERAAMIARGGNPGGGNGGRGGNNNGRGGNGGGNGGRGGGGRGGNNNARGANGRGGNGSGAGRGFGGPGRGATNAQNEGNTGQTEAPTAAELDASAESRRTNTIDRLFPALPSVETRGRAWTWDKSKKELKSLNLRLGISDGQTTELIEGDLQEGQAVVSNIIIPTAVRPGPGAQQNNPFFQNQRGGPGGRGPGGGGPPGGGGGGGGNRGGGGGGRGGD